ncbi:hypothetical protein FB446DRAFT_795838 [Lentinula raphanica]|nr:hypothetical protein FB446DRAFT_795838 [Lentinula raphanica]
MPHEATIKSYHSSPQPHPSMFGRPHHLKPNPVGWRQFVEDDFSSSAPSSPIPSSRNRVRGSPVIGYPALRTKATPTSTRLHQRLTKLSNQSEANLVGLELVEDDRTGFATSSPPPSSPTPFLRNRPTTLHSRLTKSSTTPSMRSLTNAHPIAGWEPPSDPPPPSSPTPFSRNRSTTLRSRMTKFYTAPSMRSLTHAHPLAGWEPPSAQDTVKLL